MRGKKLLKKLSAMLLSLALCMVTFIPANAEENDNGIILSENDKNEDDTESGVSSQPADDTIQDDTPSDEEQPDTPVVVYFAAFYDTEGNVITEANVGDRIFLSATGYSIMTVPESVSALVKEDSSGYFASWTIPEGYQYETIEFSMKDEFNRDIPRKYLTLKVNGVVKVKPEKDKEETTEKKEDSHKKDVQQEENVQEPVMEDPNDTVLLSGGKPVNSTVGGVYAVKGVEGAAVTSSKADVNAAAGITSPETKVSFYICDVWDKEIKNNLQSIATEQGKTIGAIIRADMYSITKDGVIKNIRQSENPVTLLFGLPKSLQDKQVSIIAYAIDGKPVVLDDTDTDPKTITVNTNVYGAFAIVY